MSALLPTLQPGPSVAATRAPRLLVSVRSACEAREAIAGGAGWIDVKEPAAGALGRASQGVLEEVVAAVAGRVGVSAAWGELASLKPGEFPTAADLVGVPLIKVGLAGCRTRGDWQAEWSALAGSLPGGTGLVMVHYADWQSCGAPGWEECLEVAASAPCSVLLFDTFDKSQGGLLSYYYPAELGVLVGRARHYQLDVVLAGSLRRCDLPAVGGCLPDMVAVRTAACRNEHREGEVCRERVAELCATLADTFNRSEG